MAKSSDAVDAILSGKNTIVTGGAGTGKSQSINGVLPFIKEDTTICAPTGIAARGVGGNTIHYTFGMPLGIPNEKDLKDVSVRAKQMFGPDSPIERLILDEGFMARIDHMWYIDNTLKLIRQTNDPFGGLQVVLSGDPLQIDPVIRGDESKLLVNQFGGRYCFEYEGWQDANFEKIVLTEVHRQKDKEFAEILGRIRTGQMTAQDLSIINSRVCNNLDSHLTLTTTNKAADQVNYRNYYKNSNKEHMFTAQAWGYKKGEEPVPYNLKLKKGLRVVICANKPDTYVNGDTGKIVEIKRSRNIVVELDSTGEYVDISPHCYAKYQQKIEKGKLVRKLTGEYSQFPLKMGYAMTTHKAQGVTLSEAHVDFGNGVFANGGAYVALSRVKSLEGLTLQRPITFNDIKVNRKALKYLYSL